jgi:hypothetical protein
MCAASVGHIAIRWPGSIWATMVSGILALPGRQPKWPLQPGVIRAKRTALRYPQASSSAMLMITWSGRQPLQSGTGPTIVKAM